LFFECLEYWVDTGETALVAFGKNRFSGNDAKAFKELAGPGVSGDGWLGRFSVQR
jgi:hypothetical protein